VSTVDDIGEKIPTHSDNYPNMPHIHVNIKTEGVEKLLKNMDPSKATVEMFYISVNVSCSRRGGT
jgi:hypothetical protein